MAQSCLLTYLFIKSPVCTSSIKQWYQNCLNYSQVAKEIYTSSCFWKHRHWSFFVQHYLIEVLLNAIGQICLILQKSIRRFFDEIRLVWLICLILLKVSANLHITVHNTPFVKLKFTQIKIKIKLKLNIGPDGPDLI